MVLATTASYDGDLRIVIGDEPPFGSSPSEQVVCGEAKQVDVPAPLSMLTGFLNDQNGKRKTRGKFRAVENSYGTGYQESLWV